MNYLNAHSYFSNETFRCDDASWPAIVDMIFDIIAHRDRLVLKRKALGRRKRKLARKHKRSAA